MLTLVLGGSASGKSLWAETEAQRHVGTDGRALFVATGVASDSEMARKIAAHKRRRRKTRWVEKEEPLDIAACLDLRRTTVIDSLTFWLFNLHAHARDVDAARDRLLQTLSRMQAPCFVVADEIGLGLVPSSELSRGFREESGKLNQCFAQAAGKVVLLVAGLPVVLKSSG